MGRPSEFVRLGILAGIAGGTLLLGACSRPGAGAEPTTTPVVTVRTTTAAPSTATRAATPIAPSSAPSVAPTAAPSVAPTAAAPAATATKPATAGRKYAVQAGDTLSSIAEQFGVTIQAIIDANQLQNPDLIIPGQDLIIPGQ